MRVTLLGTGTSTGIPVIGCTCRVCRSDDFRDHRLRCACHVETDGLSLVIDVGPDFRQQALRAAIPHVDAVLLTHHHFDHVAGLDDLRPYCFDNSQPIPCYASPETVQLLQNMYPYIFCDGTYPGVPRLTLHTVEASFRVIGRHHPDRSLVIEPVKVFHGQLPLYGYRIGRFAYLTDINHIPAEGLAQLQDLDVLVLDALRHRPHPTHFTMAEAVQVAQQIGAGQTYLIHMTHEIFHAEDDARLPKGIALGYDGLSFTL